MKFINWERKDCFKIVNHQALEELSLELSKYITSLVMSPCLIESCIASIEAQVL